MTVVFLGLEQGLLRIDLDAGRRAEWVIRDASTFSVAIDPLEPQRVYATTLGNGLFRSEDGGRTFAPAGEGIVFPSVWASAVSATERTADGGVVYAGTLPSAMFRSEDGGRTFRSLDAFQTLPSLPEASFPAAPATSLIHMIACSHNRPDTVFAGIELGGIMKSSDGGETWTETGGGLDCHQLLTHPLAPDRVYESDGAGFCESLDDGASWTVDYAGIPENLSYFYDMAVDPGDPDTVMISVGENQYQGHGINPYAYYEGAFDRTSVLPNTYSTLYRRRGSGPWTEMRDGLPAPEGHAQGRFATAAGDDAGSVYYVTIPGELHHTADGGDSWSPIDVEFPADAAGRMVHCARALKG